MLLQQNISLSEFQVHLQKSLLSYTVCFIVITNQLGHNKTYDVYTRVRLWDEVYNVGARVVFNGNRLVILISRSSVSRALKSSFKRS